MSLNLDDLMDIYNDFDKKWKNLNTLQKSEVATAVYENLVKYTENLEDFMMGLNVLLRAFKRKMSKNDVYILESKRVNVPNELAKLQKTHIKAYKRILNSKTIKETMGLSMVYANKLEDDKKRNNHLLEYYGNLYEKYKNLLPQECIEIKAFREDIQKSASMLLGYLMTMEDRKNLCNLHISKLLELCGDLIVKKEESYTC